MITNWWNRHSYNYIKMILLQYCTFQKHTASAAQVNSYYEVSFSLLSIIIMVTTNKAQAQFVWFWKAQQKASMLLKLKCTKSIGLATTKWLTFMSLHDATQPIFELKHIKNRHTLRPRGIQWKCDFSNFQGKYCSSWVI